jgi:capsular exopolysaccharide synthesis family protein
MALAFLASLGLAVVIGLWRELTDKQIRSPQDVISLTGLPVLAAVPHASIDKTHAKQDGTLLLTAQEPGSTSADQFRRILTRIIYPPEGSAELNTCLVVSPGRSDGKTSLACNLATALAQAGRRVLLVDINARNPKVEEAFGMEPGPGLGEVLFGNREPNDIVRQTEYGNLFIIGPGTQRDAVVGKLASRDMVAFLEQAEQAFDHVIIDTPPALLMADAKLLAPVVDGVVVVIGVGASTTGMTQRCLNDLRQIGSNVIGVVLNKVQPTRGGYLRRNLDQYYDYMEEGRKHEIELPEVQLPFDGEEPDESVVLVADEEEPERTGEET